MAMDTASWMGFAVLGSMKKNERKRAETPLILTMVPGAPATRAAIATVAVGNQARDSVRREGKVAEATAVVVTQAIAGAVPIDAAITAQPALRDLDRTKLAVHVGQVVAPILPIYAAGSPPVGSSTTTPPVATKVELDKAAEMVVAALGMPKNSKFTDVEAKKYKAFLDKLPQATKDSIVKKP
jgi:hypothetical protein